MTVLSCITLGSPKRNHEFCCILHQIPELLASGEISKWRYGNFPTYRAGTSETFMHDGTRPPRQQYDDDGKLPRRTMTRLNELLTRCWQIGNGQCQSRCTSGNFSFKGRGRNFGHNRTKNEPLLHKGIDQPFETSDTTGQRTRSHCCINESTSRWSCSMIGDSE